MTQTLGHHGPYWLRERQITETKSVPPLESLSGLVLKDLHDPFTNLFGFYAVYNGIEHWGEEEVEIRQKNLTLRESLFLEPVNHRQTDRRGEEKQADADVGDTGVQSLETLLPGCDTQ